MLSIRPKLQYAAFQSCVLYSQVAGCFEIVAFMSESSIIYAFRCSLSVLNAVLESTASSQIVYLPFTLGPISALN